MWHKQDKTINSGFDTSTKLNAGKFTTRRNFLKSAGIAGLSGAVAAAGAYAADANKPDANEPNVPPTPKPRKVSTRKLGKTGVDVPMLAMGLGRPAEPVVLMQALDWGVYHWDTSLVAAGGNSEASIGAFLAKNPDRRKDLFIVTKESNSKTPDDIEKCLQTSLQRLKTDYIDLYFGVYMVNDPARFTEDVKKWAQDAKKRGVIKYFGFSTHENMPACLSAAAKLDWIDAVQTAYSFRLMQDSGMQDAIDACHKAGTGIIAMKTQGMRQAIETDADRKIVAHFLEKGFTEGQAKIKAVLEDQRISTVCSAMSSSAMLMANIAAVLDETKLTAEDMGALKQYARETCSGYCAGCSHICRPVAEGVPISEIMRALMYRNSYGDAAEAKAVFAQIPAETREHLLKVDYSVAQARCPNHVPIGKLICEAFALLS
jgi:predicted aldo/keto reductase-like oxidoreductase